MAKTPIGLGQFSGRVGGVVYAVQAGRQVVRAYQPVVSNPKSSSQSIQRAKGNLVGRISKITPWQILEGLGDNKFNRRSRFLRLLLRNVTAGQAAGDPSTFNAKLNDSDFVFSEGTLIPLYSIGSMVLENVSVSATVSRASSAAAAEAAAQGLLIVLVIKQASGEWEEVQYKFLRPSDLATTPVQVTFEHRSEGAYTAILYAAPFGSVDGSALPTVTGPLTSTTNSLDAILEVGTSASSVVWGASFLASRSTFTPPTTVSADKNDSKLE